MTATYTKIQLRRDTAANWTADNTVLSAGEIGVESDTLRWKIGDGATGWNAVVYQSGMVPTGTRIGPTLILATVGIAPAGALRELQFVRGNPAAVSITANPQIVAGTIVGQELVLQGTDNVATVQVNNGNGVELNGACVLKSGSRLKLIWDGTVWGEVSRNDI